MATDIRDNSIADLLSELSQESATLIRQELGLMAADLAKHGRRVGVSAGFLGGAGVLGVGAFGALTAGLISALGRRPSRGAFMVAALYGAGAGALAEAGVKRLGRVAPEAVGTIGRDVKAAATGARKSPAEVGGDAPAKVVEAGKSPAKAVEAGKSPAKVVEDTAPAEAVEDTPAAEAHEDTPAAETHEDMPAGAADEGTPAAEADEDEAPAKADDARKAPAKAARGGKSAAKSARAKPRAKPARPAA